MYFRKNKLKTLMIHDIAKIKNTLYESLFLLLFLHSLKL